MQKHLDWKRIGWTALTDVIVTGLGSIIAGMIISWAFDSYRDVSLYWLILFIIFFLHDLITRRNFYYHNINSKNSQGYKLPLTQCETCKVKQHCLVIKVKSCPNELGEAKKK